MLVGKTTVTFSATVDGASSTVPAASANPVCVNVIVKMHIGLTTVFSGSVKAGIVNVRLDVTIAAEFQAVCMFGGEHTADHEAATVNKLTQALGET